MKNSRSALRHLALTSALVLISAASAHAVEADAFGARLKAVFKDYGTQLDWSGISEDGSRLVLQGVTIESPGHPEKVAVGDVTLDDVTEQSGGYRIGTVTLPDYRTTEDGTTVSASGLVITGLTVPAENEADPIAALMLYDSASLANLSVETGDKPVFSLTGLTMKITPPANGKPLEFNGIAEKFTADLASTADPQSKEVLDRMGYQTINGTVNVAGSWQPTDGRFDLAQYDIKVDNVGTFGMKFDIGGYTTEFLKKVQDLQKQMAAQPEGADSSAQGLAMLGLMQELTFNAASIRWDDDSLTNKLLDFFAQSQGQKPADLANQVKAIVPFLMAQLNNPELANQVTQAVTAFLDNPKSFEITARPPSAVPFAVIVAGAMSDTPQELVKTLAVSVSANSD
jgi:hypothetical protein